MRRTWVKPVGGKRLRRKQRMRRQSKVKNELERKDLD